MLRTSNRLSLQFSFLYAVLSAVVFAMAYWFTQYEVRDWVLDQMIGDALTLNVIYEQDGKQALIEKIDALAAVSFENTRVFQLLDDTGRVISGNIPDPILGTPPNFILAEELNLLVPFQFEVEGYWMREDTIGPYRLVQGSGDHIVGEILEALGTALALGYLGVIVLGLFFGVRVGRLTEQRITEISTTLSRVSEGQLDARIQGLGAPNDDLSRVSVEINNMLDQVRRLLKSQEQISNDIAHDMRTPLQRLRQRLELMSQSENVRPTDIAASLQQTEEIISTFNALLRIAQIEAVNKQEQFEPIDLGAIIRNVGEVFEPIAEDKEMVLETRITEPSAKVMGDPELLTQLLVNLVENSIKHCPVGSHIEIALEQISDATILTVSDDGPGIEPGIREQVLRRFFRAESSRNSPGNGLGLALVKAVADIHSGEIEVLGNNPGTVIQIRFQNITQH